MVDKCVLSCRGPSVVSMLAASFQLGQHFTLSDSNQDPMFWIQNCLKNLIFFYAKSCNIFFSEGLHELHLATGEASRPPK